MQAYRVEKTLQEDGTVTLEHLPFQAGDAIEIIILAQPASSQSARSESLRGLPLQYDQPFEPVAHDEWETLR